MKRRKSVVVELTSLLDVIFIILFMVMNGSRSAAAEAQNTAEEQIAAAQAEVGLMQEELENYKRILTEVEAERENLEFMENRISSYENFEEYAKILSVYILDGGYKRSIKVADDTEIATIDFDWENISYGKETLISALKDYINETENPVFIAFSYDSSNIYRQDYSMVSEAMTAVQADYDHVYIKFDDTGTD